NRREDAHQQHRGGRAEGEQLAADMQLGRNRLQEDAEALADAEADGEDNEAAPHGGPIGAGSHGAESAAASRSLQAVAAAFSHRITSCRHKQLCGRTESWCYLAAALRWRPCSWCWGSAARSPPRRCHASIASAACSARRAATRSNATRWSCWRTACSIRSRSEE